MRGYALGNGASRFVPATRKPPARRLTTRRAVCAALLAAGGAALVGAGVGSVVRENLASVAYAELGRKTSHVTSIEQVATCVTSKTRDWDSLRAENPDVAVWVTVGGTGIDLPVVATDDVHSEEWYLHHDLWGDWSASGTPFLDHRVTDVNGRSCVCYGHHMTSSTSMFSELQLAFEQSTFDTLGKLTWETSDRTAVLSPLCAMCVEQTWEDIQRFAWDDVTDEGFRTWLRSLVAQADAASADAYEACMKATLCRALVTCSSAWSGQPWRTVCLWSA